MSERQSRTPERDEHLFTPLGVYKVRCYYRTSQGVLVWFTPQELMRPGPALMLVPDLSHWRMMYPDQSRAGVSWAAAGADLMAMAQAQGEYLPGPGEGAVNGSRLPYSPSERLAAYRARQVRRRVSTMESEARREGQPSTP